MKTDLKKSITSYRAKKGKFEVIIVPEMRYLMVDGHGDPNSSKEFSSAIETLYPVAYKLKFLSKREINKDYVVPPLEALWWADDMSTFSSARDKSKWDWTLMLMVPDWLGQEHVDQAIKQVKAKGSAPLLSELRLETLNEGLCVQTLHIGSFDNEGPVLQELHESFISEQGYSMTGKHHEVYFSDFRKVSPDKLRTILRQPVKQAKAK